MKIAEILMAGMIDFFLKYSTKKDLTCLHIQKKDMEAKDKRDG